MTGPTGSVIRLANESDVDVAWELLVACRTALLERGIAQWDTIYPSRDTVRNDVASAALYMLTADNGCVGLVTLDGNAHSDYASMEWESEEPALIVHRLCVRPGMQGRGFGQRLMRFAEEHAANNGYRSIRLDAYSGNASAVSFYQQRGYRQVGQLYFPRRPLPFYLYEWRVPQRLRGPM